MNKTELIDKLLHLGSTIEICNSTQTSKKAKKLAHKLLDEYLMKKKKENYSRRLKHSQQLKARQPGRLIGSSLIHSKIMDNKETEQKVNHGLSNELYTLLCTVNFEPKSMAFYNSRGQKPDGSWDNFLDSIDCMSKHIKSHMGGNYGLADEYLIVKHDGIFKFQYFGDSSAIIKKIAEADKESVLQYCVNGA